MALSVCIALTLIINYDLPWPIAVVLFAAWIWDLIGPEIFYRKGKGV